MLFKNCLGMIWSVSTLARSSGAIRPLIRRRGSKELERSHVHEVSGKSCGRRHRRAEEMRAATGALTAFEVAVARRGAAFARRQDVGIHAQAHRAAGIAPLKTRRFEHFVEPLLLGCK